MGTHKNTITINGQVYDTNTGKELPESDVFHVKVRTQKSSSTSSNIKVSSNSSESFKVNVRRSAGIVSHNVHKKTQHPKTLMRSVLKDPKLREHPEQVNGLISQSQPVVVKGALSRRQERTSAHAKSKSVLKFAPTTNVEHRSEHVPVKAAPSESVKVKVENLSDEDASKYVVKAAPPIYSKKQSKSDSESSFEHQAKLLGNIFETALQGANSFQPSHLGSSSAKKSRSKIWSFASGFAAVVILAGFFAYHNATGIAIRGASSTAGFSASLPKYMPTGFHVSNRVAASPGKITISYLSNTAGGGYNLIQERTNLSESELTSNYITNKTGSYSSVTRDGKTIYIYDGSNATWLKDGIHYVISGQANLSAGQLSEIASSL